MHCSEPGGRIAVAIVASRGPGSLSLGRSAAAEGFGGGGALLRGHAGGGRAGVRPAPRPARLSERTRRLLAPVPRVRADGELGRPHDPLELDQLRLSGCGEREPEAIRCLLARG